VLDTLWQSATDSRGRIAVVSGAAGIGKSHLIQHFVERVEASGAQALIGHCYEFEQALPYQAPAEMLRSAGHLVRHADLASAHRSALALLVPDVLEVSAGPGDLSSEDLRSQVFEALFQAFLALSRSQPLLIVVEDVHWASESMLDWLTYIAPRLGDARMLVVVTHRTDEVDGNQPLDRLHRRLARVAEVDNLLLAPLTAAEHRALVTRLAGLPEERVTPLADRLFAETAGNPFFLMEVVRSLIETGQITLEDGRWAGSFVDDDREIDLPLPDSIRDLVITRFERLGPVSQTFAQVASVAGRVFRYEIVRDAATIADEPALAALDEVLQRGLIEQHDRAGDFRFSHHLIQEVTYAAMTAPRRAFWHGRLAEAILILQPDDVESLAHHFNRAGDDERARGYYAQAGDRAQQLAAFDDAARHYRAALNRWPEHDRAGRAGLFSKRGLCLWVLGEATAALESLDAGQALYDSLHDNLRVGDIERLIGRIHWEQGDRQTALDHYHRALAILEREPESVELARAVSAISQMHMLAAEFDEAIVWGERALALAERLNAEDVAIHALINIGSSLTSPEESERGLTILRESLDRANAANLSHDAMRACHNLAERLVNLGQYTEAQEMNAALLEQARRVHSDLFTGVALQFLIQVNWLTGRWAEALRNREAILDWLRSSSPPRLTLIWAARVLGMLHNDLGQADVACQMLERELAAARDAAEEQTTVPHLAELARSYAALGRDADAAATVRELLGWIERLPDVSFNCITPLLIVCRWYASGSTPSDLAALNRCVTWLERVATKVDTLESRVALAEGQGLAFLAEGEPAAAVEQFRLAVAGWELLGRPPDQARALSLLGNALSLDGHASDGRDAVDRARSICNELASQLTDPQLASSFRHSALRRSLHPER
jgi:tetratricopeptide (TPR) repeat protein